MNAAHVVTCDIALAQLTEFVDRELSPDQAEALARHLGDCQSCHAVFETERSTVQGMREKIAEIRMPAEARARLWAAIREASGHLAL